MKKTDEINLVQAALEGDVDSFSRLCEYYYPTITSICYAHLSDRNMAEDVAQEAFYIAFRDISKLRKAEHFGRWITKICRNISSDMVKARNRNKLIATKNSEAFTSENNKQNSYHDEIVRNVISNLPFKAKEVIFLKFYNKLSYQEISDILGISLEAVNGRLRRAKKLIAEELGRFDSVEVNL